MNATPCGVTPLDIAARWCALELCVLLLQYGALLTQRALMEATTRGGNDNGAVCGLLLDHAMENNLELHSMASNCLQWAKSSGNATVVRLWLQYGANISNQADRQSVAPFLSDLLPHSTLALHAGDTPYNDNEGFSDVFPPQWNESFMSAIRQHIYLPFTIARASKYAFAAAARQMQECAEALTVNDRTKAEDSDDETICRAMMECLPAEIVETIVMMKLSGAERLLCAQAKRRVLVIYWETFQIRGKW